MSLVHYDSTVVVKIGITERLSEKNSISHVLDHGRLEMKEQESTNTQTPHSSTTCKHSTPRLPVIITYKHYTPRLPVIITCKHSTPRLPVIITCKHSTPRLPVIITCTHSTPRLPVIITCKHYTPRLPVILHAHTPYQGYL